MDLLQKELERKKKALQGAKSGSSRYVRVGDLRRKQIKAEAYSRVYSYNLLKTTDTFFLFLCCH